MYTLKTFCGDWSLGWGFGGRDRIGKLFLDPDGMLFTWKGYRQGRHGNKSKTYFVDFTYDTVTKEYEWVDGVHLGGLPIQEQVVKSIEQLLYDHKYGVTAKKDKKWSLNPPAHQKELF